MFGIYIKEWFKLVKCLLTMNEVGQLKRMACYNMQKVRDGEYDIPAKEQKTKLFQLSMAAANKHYAQKAATRERLLKKLASRKQ